MKMSMKKPPLRGFVIGDTIFLQATDWRNVCQYDCIEFHARARCLTNMPEEGKTIVGDQFGYRQITSGDCLCLNEAAQKKK